MKNIHKNKKIISIFQPHRYSRVKSLKKEFSKSFINSDLVILCPIYSAGEKKDRNYNENQFAKLIAVKSKVQVIIINGQEQLNKYFKKNLINNELIIGMGAGTISKWIRDLKDIL